MSDGSPEGWVCSEDCPIRLMNLQSGHLHGSGNKSDTASGRDKGYAASSYEVAYAGRANRDYGSEGGGAARFFPNFSQEDSLQGKPAERKAEARVLVGDCVEVMREMPESSVDAIVTDPPAGIAFMGAEWDSNKGSRNAWIAWLTEVMEEAYRVMKPGAHGLVWALPRTSHWTAMALEDAGFEIRDRVAHIFGSGFPKSASIEKHMTKMQGQLRRAHGMVPLENPESARLHQGQGTALKPSVEDWWLIRKPLSEAGVARNVLAHSYRTENGTRYVPGTGALNIEQCRVSHAGANDLATSQAKNPGRSDTVTSGVYGKDRPQQQVNTSGRWPPTLALSHSPSCRPTGEVRRVKGGGGAVVTPSKNRTVGFTHGDHYQPISHRDPEGYEPQEVYDCDEGCPTQALGEAARFFPRFHEPFKYAAKASRRERQVGLDGMPEKIADPYGEHRGRRMENKDRFDGKPAKVSTNNHPTVKPLMLMRWLVKLVTPPGGTVLDPFCGSGSTGCAAVLEGFNFVGIEMSEEYAEIAERRIAHWSAESNGKPPVQEAIETLF